MKHAKQKIAEIKQYFPYFYIEDYLHLLTPREQKIIELSLEGVPIHRIRHEHLKDTCYYSIIESERRIIRIITNHIKNMKSSILTVLTQAYRLEL